MVRLWSGSGKFLPGNGLWCSMRVQSGLAHVVLKGECERLSQMRVAVATFGDRVSPRFDCAASFLVVSIDAATVVQRQEVSAAAWAPHERINRLVELQIEAVVCGGIDRWSAESLRAAGIRLFAWLTGSIQENLDRLTRGELVPVEVPAVGDCCQRSGDRSDVASQEESAQSRGAFRGGRSARRQRRRGQQDWPDD